MGVDWLGAVMTGANGDAVLIEDGRDVVWVDTVQGEGDKPGPFLRPRAKDAHTFDLRHLFIGVGGQSVLLLPDPIEPHFAEVVHCGAQADAFGDGRGAGLKLVGDGVPAAAAHFDFADHVAAAHEGGHDFKQFALAIEDADTRGPAHLVPAEDEKISVQRFHVDGHVGHAL